MHWDDPEGWYGEEGGFRMGNTCIPVADSCWYMAKPIQYCKVKKKKRIGALKKKPLSVQFEFTQRVSIGKVQLLWNDCIVLYFMYLRVIPKTSYKYHKYMVCKKSMSKIWFYGKKILLFLYYSNWGKLSSYQCYIPFYPAKKLRILGAIDKRSTIKERMQLLNT